MREEEPCSTSETKTPEYKRTKGGSILNLRSDTERTEIIRLEVNGQVVEDDESEVVETRVV